VTQVTSRLKAATWVVNVYLHHPALCVQTAAAVDYTSRGHLILGLERFSFVFTKHDTRPWMPTCADIMDQEMSSSVIPAKAGIQFLVNAFALCSRLSNIAPFVPEIHHAQTVP
jgi:hypothetical protein